MNIVRLSSFAALAFLVGCHAHHELPNSASCGSHAHEHASAAILSRSVPGKNIWNRGEKPADPWAEMERWHGHVGPWNVIGLRIGEAILREGDATWGDHSMDIVVHIPLSTPYSCLIDGLMVGTGNGPGRLDLRTAEVETMEMIYVSARRKDGSGALLVMRPNQKLLHRIETNPADKLEDLSRDCLNSSERALFTIEALN